jgi:hypothetical protein
MILLKRNHTLSNNFASLFGNRDYAEPEEHDGFYLRALIGFSGTRKRVDPHLHFEIRHNDVKLDLIKLYKTSKDWGGQK